MQQTKYYQLIGGENLSQPAITIQPGELLASNNYESVTTGGYKRIDGYERFDGQLSPTNANFKVLPFNTGTIAFVQGDVVTGTVSGATATVVDTNLLSGTFATSDAVGELAVIITSGLFVATDELQVSAVTNAIQSGSQQSGADTDLVTTQFLISTQEYTRSLIAAVPGEGSILGTWLYNGVVYAFRNNVGSTQALMYKSSTIGWQLVTTPVLNPNGKYRFVNYNFTGNAGSVKLYGCDGENKAFEFDGTTFTQITTGMTVDKPKFIAGHKRHLFLAFAGGSLQFSPIADPTGVWTVVLGAGEIGTGGEITSLKPMTGDVLAIFNRNATYLLYGTSAADWNLILHSDESGAITDSVQRLGTLLYVDDRGITTLEAVQSFGDFASSTLSQKVNKKLVAIVNSIVASVRIKNKDQYRVFFANGNGMCLTFSSNKVVGITSLQYGKNIKNICNSEDLTGQERIFFGTDEGFVYEMDKGTSFDGQALTSSLRLAFNHIGSPAYNKRFFKAVFEMEGGSEATIKFNADYSYASNLTPVPIEQNFTVQGGGGYWDVDNWDEIVWDGQPVSLAEAYLDGIGKNIGLFIYCNEIYESPHTLQGAILYYSGRGLAK